MFEDPVHSNFTQTGNSQELVFGSLMDIQGKIFWMKHRPMLFRIDIERKIASPVKTDIRFCESVPAHEKINLVQPMFAHKHTARIQLFGPVDRVMPETFLIGAEIDPFEMKPVV